MNHYVFASYMMENSTNDLRVYDIMRMTHLNYSFAHIIDDVVTVDHLDFLDRLDIYKRINPALRINLSIGGWGADGFSQAAKTEEGRRTFVESSLAILEKWGFDGIDIDWEYPCVDTAEIACDPSDKYNCTYLMQDLRKALDEAGKAAGKKYELSIAVAGGELFIRNTEMDKIAEAVDYVNLMTYDLRGSGDNHTGHHTNLGPQCNDPDGPSSMHAVEIYHEAGVPYEKMVLGSAFYGKMWMGVKEAGEFHGLGQDAATPGGGWPEFDLQKEQDANLHGYTRYWDESAKAAYYFNGENLISYEDPQSLRLKCAYVKEKGLAGLMYWAYGNHVLFDIAAINLKDFPAPPHRFY